MYGDIIMPFAGFEDFDECLQTMQDEEGHDQEAAENICGALQAEEKSEHGNVDELREALASGAGLIADVGVDLVSGVDVPAVDSKWVAMKADSDDHDYRVTTRLLKAEDTDQRITYAAAMIPREPDKEGDVAPTPTVEKAAHNFLKSDGGIDTDHSLIDGEGQPVESWVLKEERTFDLPSGGTETYGEGTWMLGIEWGKEAWERIQAGELTGLSIYGMAEHVPLERAACGCESTAKQLGIPVAGDPEDIHLTYLMEEAAERASEDLGLDGAVHPHTLNDQTVYMPGATHERFIEALQGDLEDATDPAVAANASGDTHKSGATESDGMAQEQASDGGGDADSTGETDDSGGPDIGEVAASVEDLAETVESVKEAIDTEKQDERELAADLGDMYDMAPGDVLDILTAAADHDAAQVMDALDSLSAQAADEEAKADDEDDDDEDDEDDEMEASTEKRADEANLGKGGSGRTTAAKAHDVDSGSGGLPSYAAAAEEQESD